MTGAQCSRCGRKLITRRGDHEPTCSSCRKAPDDCVCKSLLELEVFAPPSNPMPVARQILKDRKHDNCLTLRWWRGGWTAWNGTQWSEDEPDAVRAAAYQRLERAAFEGPNGRELWEPNQRKVSDVLDALKALTLLPEGTDNPSWLPGTVEPFPAAETVTCTNGILHVRSGRLEPLTPRLFSHVSVPFPHDPDAPEPRKWLEFLGQLWPDDKDSPAALQEFFGYVLSGRTDMHKILLFIGPPRSGRGTIARVLAALLGHANVAHPTLASLCTQFGMQPLIGKPLAIVGDARLPRNSDVSQVVERLLSISGEDPMTIDRKHKAAWTGKLPTRFIIVSNELPEFADSSGAIASRFLILTLQNSFLGQEDHALTQSLLTELPGILQWTLKGLARLSEQDRFTVPQSSNDAVVALQDMASPIRAFIRDKCQMGGEVPVDTLWNAWRDWAEDNNVRKGTKQVLGRDLRAALPAVRQVRPRDGDDRYRAYVGISLVGAAIGAERGPARPNPPTSENAEMRVRDEADQTAAHGADRSAGLDGPRSGPIAAPTRETLPSADSPEADENYWASLMADESGDPPGRAGTPATASELCQVPGCNRAGRLYPGGQYCRHHRPHSERNKR